MDGDVRRNAASLKVRKVLFRTDRKWLNNLNLQCRFERGGVSRIQKESSCRGTASCQGTGVHCRTPHIAYCRICAYHGSFKEFGSKGTAGKAFARYVALSVCIMLLSAGGTWLLGLTGLSSTLAKLITDTLLYFVSYRVQQQWVFKEEA